MQVRHCVVDVDLNGIPADSDVNNRSCRKERDADFERHIAPLMIDSIAILFDNQDPQKSEIFYAFGAWRNVNRLQPHAMFHSDKCSLH